MTKKNSLVPGEYLINEEKRTVVFAVKAHDQIFVGKANCMENDKFDVETGKAIAHMRAVLAQRKFDLKLTREFIDVLKDNVITITNFGDPVSPHFMRAIQIAHEEEKAQLAHIHDIENRLEQYKA